MSISRLKPQAPKLLQPVIARRPAPRPAPQKQSPKSAFEPARPKGPSLDAQRPNVTRADAIKRARELLEGPVKSTTQADGSIIVQDAPYVNDSKDLTGKRAEEAARQVADNVALEGEALDKLSAKDRARYLSVKKTLLAEGEGRPQGDPVAALALQTMLLEGKLPGGELLKNLSKLNKQELAPGVDRQQLLSDVVQEVAVPEAIAQRNRGTCVPTSIEIMLVQQDPAEYVRLIAGLASPAGEVTTAGGDVLKREEGVLEDGTSRSLSQKLLAPALMELGNGLADYDNEADEHVGGALDGKSGLTAAQADAVLESVFGQDFAFHTTGNAEEKKAGTDFVLEELEAGRDVLVGIKWGTGGHKVLVTGTETRDGVEYLKIINPWGREELIPRDDFEERLRNVNYDPNS